MYEFSQYAFVRPTSFTTIVNLLTVDAQFNSPIGGDLGLSGVGEPNIISAVSPLLGIGRPSAVAWSVIIVCVYPVDAVASARSRPHILIKCGEGMQPTLTDPDTSAPIARIPVLAWVITAGLHRAPYPIFTCVATSSRLAMLKAFAMTATTALRMPGTQTTGIDNASLAAIATTEPNGILFPFPQVAENKPAIKTLSRKVLKPRVSWDRMILNHDSFPFKRVAARAA